MVTFLVNRDGVNERAGFAVVDGDADGFGGVTFAVALRCAAVQRDDAFVADGGAFHRAAKWSRRVSIQCGISGCVALCGCIP